MAILKQTIVSGGLFVTGSENFVSASEFRGPLNGTASYAERAASASIADKLDPNANLQAKSLLISGNAQIGGDLKVLGDLTYVGVQDLRVHDHIIEINSDESGSAVGSADGAGVIIRNADAAGDIELIYSASDDKLHVNKTIAGTIENAASANKVQYKLHIKVQHSGSAATEENYDGSAVVSASVDFTSVEETLVQHSASLATIREDIESIAGGSGSISTQISGALETLNADASAAAAGTPVSGGVFVLSGVAFNEAVGKLTSGSATSVEVEEAGAAAKAKAELLGGDSDATSSMTLHGIKNYVDAKTGEGITAFSESVSSSQAAQDARLNAIEEATSSYVTSASLATIVSQSAVDLAALSASVANTDATQSNKITALESASATSSARLNAIEQVTASLDNKYVAKAGDTMSGDLDMGSNGIKLGDCRMVYNSVSHAVEFVFAEEDY